MLQVVYGRTRVNGMPEDVAINVFHFLSGTPWPTTPPSNYEEAEQAFDDYWAALKTPGRIPERLRISEYRWYREDDDTLPWGPPARVTARSLAGTTGVVMLPPQVSCVVTEYTGLQETVLGRQQRHWGRFYLPVPGEGSLQADGTLGVSTQDLILAQSVILYDRWSAAGLIPIVRTTNVGTGNLPVLAEVVELRVDDVLDIQRRRRYESVGRRVTAALIDRSP
jgi:hypothetical protein